MKTLRRIFDEFFDKIIDEHIQSDKGEVNKGKDFVDAMLDFVGTEESEYRIERPNIKAILLVREIIITSLSIFPIIYFLKFKSDAYIVVPIIWHDSEGWNVLHYHCAPIIKDFDSFFLFIDF